MTRCFLTTHSLNAGPKRRNHLDSSFLLCRTNATTKSAAARRQPASSHPLLKAARMQTPGELHPLRQVCQERRKADPELLCPSMAGQGLAPRPCQVSQRGDDTRANAASKNGAWEWWWAAAAGRDLSPASHQWRRGLAAPFSLELPRLLLQQVDLAQEEIQVKGRSSLHGAGYCSGQQRGTSLDLPPTSPFLEGGKVYQQHQGRTLSQQRHLHINLLINLVGMRQGTQRSWSL